MDEDNKRYDAAFSFAGEDRKIARSLATKLRNAQYSVFFDEFEKAELWGQDLTVTLKDIYKNRARFCVMFVSDHYARKPWTNHERQAAISRLLKDNTAYILPIRLDDTDLPGLSDTIGYVDYRSTDESEILGLLRQKLGPSGIQDGDDKAVSVDRIREVLAACYRRAIFARLHAQISYDAMFASLAECRASLQKVVVYVEPSRLQRLVASIIGELDFIERRRATVHSKSGEFQVNSSKLRVIAALLRLRDEARIPFEIPRSVTEECFFSEEDASSQPSNYESPDPWMRLREYSGFEGKGPIILYGPKGDL